MASQFGYRLSIICCVISLIIAPTGAEAQVAQPATVTIGTSPQGFTQIGNTIFFTAAGQGTGFELWRTNGYGPGTRIVKDIRPGAMSSMVLPPNFTGGLYTPLNTQFIELNGKAYFWANDGVHGYELWSSDGTETGTQLIKDTQAGSNGIVPADATSLPVIFKANNLLFFGARTSAGIYQLWRSDGTNTGTFLLVNNYQGFYTSVSFQELNGQTFFNAFNGLWQTDGTVTNTVRVKDINTGRLNKIGPTLFVAVTAANGNSSTLWKSDGTDLGTVEIPGGSVASECPGFNFILNPYVTTSHVFFSSSCGRLWASDGLTTTLVLTNTTSSALKEFTALSNLLFFNNSGSIWKSDGTIAGTVLVGPTRTNSLDYTPLYLTTANNQIFFRGASDAQGLELWKVNDALNGTGLLRDIKTGPSFSDPQMLQEAGGFLYFSADDDVYSRELWRSDGTITGTVRLRDVQWPYQVYLPVIIK